MKASPWRSAIAAARDLKAREKEAKAAAEKERLAAAAAAAKRELLGCQGRAVVVQERLPPPREQRTFEEYEAARVAKEAAQVRAYGPGLSAQGLRLNQPACVRGNASWACGTDPGSQRPEHGNLKGFRTFGSFRA